MPLNLQSFISPVASRIRGFLPEEEDKERLRQKFQQKAISIAQFAKRKPEMVSPVSEEETQRVRIRQKEEKGELISPIPLKPAVPEAQRAAVRPSKLPSVQKKEPILKTPSGEVPVDAPFKKEISSAFGKLAGQAYRVLSGENARFRVKAENVNKDGTTDRGLFQINEGTYLWMDSSKYYRKKMDKAGIGRGDKGWEDMFNPTLNSLMAKIVFEFHKKATGNGWSGWYGAPPDLRGE